ncbi:MAG: prolyl oligopeptidase family serine peptidase [Actinomycetota bacterium]
MKNLPAWQLRFSAPQVGFPAWTEDAPDHLAFLSNESGSWQAWAIDLTTGDRRRVSNEPVGVETLLVTPDGRIVWWRDDTGDERGRWMAAAFDGGGSVPLVPGIAEGWTTGISFANEAIALGLVTDEGYMAFVVRSGEAPQMLCSEMQPSGIGREFPPGTGGISSDGGLVCLRHSGDRDILNHGLRVLDARDGSIVGELADLGSNLDPVAWSPVPGEDRLLFMSELSNFERPAVWEPRKDARRDLTVDLPGAAIPVGWWPDGSAILVRHEFEGMFGLYRVEPENGQTSLVAQPHGEILDAAVRPDGDVWYLTSDSAHPARTLNADGREMLAPRGARAPAGRPFRSFWFENPHRQRIQAFVATPPGDDPHPTIMSVHGGPEWHDRDAFDPETQALVDEGFAVALVNYRGSTGYGVAFRRALIGNPWFPETEDVIAGLDALIIEGITDPDRVGFAGWSWGGCLACLNEGLHPDRWKAVFAGIPAGDMVAAHYASMPEIQAYDIAMYGGSPDEVPSLYAERNPMTYVDRAIAPVLVIAGERDPRCPIEGITPWVAALKSRGVSVDVHLYPEGHHANAVSERVHHMELILDFFRRHL